jgi:hypothetical protein
MPRYSSFFYLFLFNFYIFFDRLCYFVHKFCHIYKNLTFVFVYFVKNVIASKELRETVQSPLYNVKQLKVKVIDPYNIIELVDALLWISPLLEILWIERCRDANICFKVHIAYVHS